MAVYEAEGVVVELFERKDFPSGFFKRDIVIDVAEKESNYPSPTLFSFKKESISCLDKVNVGDIVNIGFAVDGRGWDDPKTGYKRYFVDLTGLRIKVLKSAETKELECPDEAGKEMWDCIPRCHKSFAEFAEENDDKKGNDLMSAYVARIKEITGSKPRGLEDCDWDKVDAEICGSTDSSAAGDFDDLPF